MARTRRNAMLIDETRKRVQTTQLVKRLQEHAFGDLNLSKTQIRATEILLRKTMPDLTATTLETGETLADALAAIKVTFGS